MKRATASVILFGALAAGCATHRPVNTAHANGDEITNPNTPLTANTRFAAGQVAESQGDLPRAITQYQEATRLDPSAPAPYLRLGMIYTNLKQYDQAVEQWNQYIKTTNGSAAGYCNLGLTQELAQRFNAAEDAYKSAIAKEPTNEPAHVNYGLMLARQNRIDDAITQLQAVLTPAEAHYNVASVLESQGQNLAARGEYEKAIKIDPDMNDAKARLAALDTN